MQGANMEVLFQVKDAMLGWMGVLNGEKDWAGRAAIDAVAGMMVAVTPVRELDVVQLSVSLAGITADAGMPTAELVVVGIAVSVAAEIAEVSVGPGIVTVSVMLIVEVSWQVVVSWIVVL